MNLITELNRARQLAGMGPLSEAQKTEIGGGSFMNIVKTFMKNEVMKRLEKFADGAPKFSAVFIPDGSTPTISGRNGPGVNVTLNHGASMSDVAKTLGDLEHELQVKLSDAPGVASAKQSTVYKGDKRVVFKLEDGSEWVLQSGLGDGAHLFLMKM